MFNRDPKGEKHDRSYIHQWKHAVTFKLIHTQCLVLSTQPNTNMTSLSRDPRDLSCVRRSLSVLLSGVCVPCWSPLLLGLVSLRAALLLYFKLQKL